jgi:hypothetical protein
MGTLTTHSLPASASMRRGDETRKRFSWKSPPSWSLSVDTLGRRGRWRRYAIRALPDLCLGIGSEGPGHLDPWIGQLLESLGCARGFLFYVSVRGATEPSASHCVSQLAITRPAMCVMASPGPSPHTDGSGRTSLADMREQICLGALPPSRRAGSATSATSAAERRAPRA